MSSSKRLRLGWTCHIGGVKSLYLRLGTVWLFHVTNWRLHKTCVSDKPMGGCGRVRKNVSKYTQNPVSNHILFLVLLWSGAQPLSKWLTGTSLDMKKKNQVNRANSSCAGRLTHERSFNRCPQDFEFTMNLDYISLFGLSRTHLCFQQFCYHSPWPDKTCIFWDKTAQFQRISRKDDSN